MNRHQRQSVLKSFDGFSNRPNDFSLVPDEVSDCYMRLLNGSEFKVLVCLARTFSDLTTPRISQSSIAESVNLGTNSIRETLRSLIAKGLVRRTPGMDPKRVVLLLQKKGATCAPLATAQCSWCGSLTYRLHAHHYPVPRQDGGTETVSICANCHGEYHHLVGDMFEYCGGSLA